MDTRLIILAVAFALVVVSIIVLVVSLVRARRGDELPDAPMPGVAEWPMLNPAPGDPVAQRLADGPFAEPSGGMAAVLSQPLRTGTWRPDSAGPVDVPAPSSGDYWDSLVDEPGLLVRDTGGAPAPSVPAPPTSAATPAPPHVQAPSDHSEVATSVMPVSVAATTPEIGADPDGDHLDDAIDRLWIQNLVAELETPESQVVTAPVPAPAPVVAPEPAVEPAVVAPPAPAPEPAPEPVVVAPPAPEPEPAPEPAPEPVVVAAPVPAPVVAPEPAVVAAPVPAPVVAPEPEPELSAEEGMAEILASFAPVAPRPRPATVVPAEPVAPAIEERPRVAQSVRPPESQRPVATVTPAPVPAQTTPSDAQAQATPAVPGVEATVQRPRSRIRDISAADVPEHELVAPVEMWFGDARVGVKPGSKTYDRFQRIAKVLFDDLRASTPRT